MVVYATWKVIVCILHPLWLIPIHEIQNQESLCSSRSGSSINNSITHRLTIWCLSLVIMVKSRYLKTKDNFNLMFCWNSSLYICRFAIVDCLTYPYTVFSRQCQIYPYNLATPSLAAPLSSAVVLHQIAQTQVGRGRRKEGGEKGSLLLCMYGNKLVVAMHVRWPCTGNFVPVGQVNPWPQLWFACKDSLSVGQSRPSSYSLLLETPWIWFESLLHVP